MDEDQECFHEAETRSLVAVDEMDRVYQRVNMLENVIVDMFSTISALKNAYIKLQAAHSPYNADKLRSADRLVISELRKLSELKHMLKGSKISKQQEVSNGSDAAALMLLQQQMSNGRKYMEELEMSVKEKQAVIDSYDSHMQQVHKQLADNKDEIERLKELLERKLDRRFSNNINNINNRSDNNNASSSTSLLFQQVAESSRGQAFGFAKLLVGLMKNAEWDLEAAANSIQPGVAYARPVYTRFAFDSYVCHRMFNGFENENFYLSGSLSSILDPGKHRHDCFVQFEEMRYADPMDLLSATPDSMFGKFCHRKYLQIVHEKMEESFFGHSQHRNQVLNGEHPASEFYHKFVELAKGVWLLHRLAFSFNPTASIFQVKKDTSFHPDFMDSVVQLEPAAAAAAADSRTVAFTIMPGFRLENAVFKCLVYVED